LTEDRTTIPLSPDGAKILADLVEAGWFETEVAAFQCAVALALAQGLDIDRSKLRGATTKFNVGTLDLLIRELVLRLDEQHNNRPYERATVLAEAGLRRLTALVDDGADAAEVLGIGSFEGDRPFEESTARPIAE
jgi:hypothetical protein